MKDVYTRLGIDPQASSEEVAAALELKPELSGFSAILQNETKRAVYDRTHETLRMIGLLRHRLGLDSGDSWFVQSYADFTPGVRSARTSAKPAERKSDAAPPRVNPETTSHQGAQTHPVAHSRRLLPILVGIAVVILLLLFIAYF